MTVKDLKKLIEKMPDDRQIVLAKYNKGITHIFTLEACINTEHQEKVNELWFSVGFSQEVLNSFKK